MAHLVREFMTKDPITLAGTATVFEAAQKMKERGVGNVIVTKDSRLSGIVTDRDIVVRGVAAQKDLGRVTLDEVCSQELATVSPDDEVGAAVQLMRNKGIRRLPVMDGGRPVGILSLGDLAQALDQRSVLGEISAKPPNQ